LLLLLALRLLHAAFASLAVRIASSRASLTRLWLATLLLLLLLLLLEAPDPGPAHSSTPSAAANTHALRHVTLNT
jgi:hypothetical protein